MLFALAGCGSRAGDDAGRRRLTLYLGSEPPSLNTLISEDNTSYQILDHISEGLLGFDLKGNLVPAVAEHWEFDPQGSATFHLRTDARWSDGSPVTAEDFVFAWRAAVDPSLGSGYAYILYPVRNAEAINHGQLPVEALGVSAPDAHTLVVQLQQPTPYFLSLTAFSVYRPIKEAFYRRQGTRYAAEADTLLYDGPYVLRRWVHGAELLLERNPYYWNRSAIAIDEIAYSYVTNDPATVLNLFRDGKVALADLNDQTVEVALREHFNIRVKQPGDVNYLGFNLLPDRPTHSLALRRAVQAVIDTQALTLQVIGRPGVEPGLSIYPAWIRHRYMRDAPIAPAAPVNDIQLQRLMASARAEWPRADAALTLLISDDATSARVAQYLQAVLAERLGLALRIDRQTFKQLLARTNSAQYDLVLHFWAPDFDDPLAYANVLLQKYDDGRPRFENADANSALAAAATAVDPAQRVDIFCAVHRIVVEQVPLIPLFVTGGSQFALYVQDPRLKNVRRSTIAGDPNFNFATLSGPP
jgi:oligopeptide transport system substrate-binding protein